MKYEEIELWDKMKALTQLGKFLDMWGDVRGHDQIRVDKAEKDYVADAKAERERVERKERMTEIANRFLALAPTKD